MSGEAVKLSKSLPKEPCMLIARPLAQRLGTVLEHVSHIDDELDTADKEFLGSLYAAVRDFISKSAQDARVKEGGDGGEDAEAEGDK